jgi:hypothetical protein
LVLRKNKNKKVLNNRDTSRQNLAHRALTEGKMQCTTAELFFKVRDRWDGLPAEFNVNRTHLKNKAYPSFSDPEWGNTPFISHGSF